MFCRIVALTFLLLVSGSVKAEDQNADDAAYSALVRASKISSKTINAAGCLVTGVADFEIYQQNLPKFRDAWLNRDQSIDFYRQRQKQVFTYIVVKRFAELLTEGIYRGAQETAPPECSFSISAAYSDKFGQPQTTPAISWRFSQKQAARVNWEKFDPRNFHEIAINYAVSPEIQAWLSDEPSMTSAPTQAPPSRCNMALFRANAVFIRATTFCTKNYMDSEAGYAALAGAKQCAASSGLDESKIKSAMLELDALVQRRGRAHACKWVESIAQQIVSANH